MLGTLLDAWHIDTNRLVSLTDTISDLRDKVKEMIDECKVACAHVESRTHTWF